MKGYNYPDASAAKGGGGVRPNRMSAGSKSGGHYGHKGTQGSGTRTAKHKGTQGSGSASPKAKGAQGRG